MKKMKTYTSRIRAHEIDSFPAAVIRARSRAAGTIPRAIDLSHTAWERGYHLPGAINGNLLAGAHTRNGWRGIAAKARSGGLAALESAGTRAQA
jgi:hypothetical protein